MCPTILGHYALRAIQYDICEKSKNNHDTIETFLKAVNKDFQIKINYRTIIYRTKCFRIFFETEWSCCKKSRQRQGNCYS